MFEMFLIVSRGYEGTESPQGGRRQADAVCPARPGGQGQRALGAKKTPPRAAGRRRTAREGKPQRARERQTAAPAHTKPKTAGEGKRDPAQRGSGKPQPPQETKKGGERGKTRPAERGKTAAAREEAPGRPSCRISEGLHAWPGRAECPCPLCLLSSVVPMGLSLFVSGAKKERKIYLRSYDLRLSNTSTHHISRPKPPRAQVAPLRCPILVAIKS